MASLLGRMVSDALVVRNLTLAAAHDLTNGHPPCVVAGDLLSIYKEVVTS